MVPRSLPDVHLRPLARSAFLQFQNLSIHAKVGALVYFSRSSITAGLCFLLLFNAGLITLIVLVTPDRIAQFMYDLAVVIRRLPYGSLILIAVIVLISFPPFIGHTTLINLCGFTYGIQGFIPATIATIGGSALVFVVLRSLFSSTLRKWAASNEKWAALEAVIRARGLPLIILIRISPFPPWVYSNSLFASIESVSLTQFTLATLFVLPRIMVYVFVGSRIASLSDGEQRSRMDAGTKFLNTSLVVGGIVISIMSSSVVYYFVQKEIKLLHDSRSTVDGTDAEAPEDAEGEEEIPLLLRS